VNSFPQIKIIFVFLLLLLFISCRREKTVNENYNHNPADIAYSPQRDSEIQQYNLNIKKEESNYRAPYDTLSLLEYVLNNYPEGSYIVDFDKTFRYNIPKPAVIYYDNNNYVFTVIAESKKGERLIEVKNIVGYEQSFINLDSTKLGTAFFYLTLFRCKNNTFQKVWEKIIPSNGGFNRFRFEKWGYNATPYIKVDFYYAQGIGHIDYNYFMINGIDSLPQLLMTYKGINFERTLANVNNDKYPDYYQHIFFDTGDRIISRDSIAFIWDKKRQLYASVRNRHQTSPY
jgi:hypothetical protein